MENNRFTPKDIANGKLKFAIPVYQRLFAWQQKEVRNLLFDLKEHFDKNPSGSPYYIGMMTVISNNGKYDLIDGQQRFTVMMLIASVLKKYDNRWNEFLKSKKDCRLVFTARSADNDYMNRLAMQDNTDGDKKNAMATAIACIHEFLKYPETGTDEVAKKYEFHNREEVELFAKNVFEHLTFFLAELPPEYLQHPASLNKYFEVMNSAGKGLEQHEILMVMLLRNQSNQGELTKIWNMVSQMDRPVFDIENKVNKELADKEYSQKVEELICTYRKQYSDGSYFKEVGTEQPSDNHGQRIEDIDAKQLTNTNYFNERHEDSILSFPEFLLLVLELTLDEENPEHEKKQKFRFYQKDKLLSNFGYGNEDDKTEQTAGLIKDVPKFFFRMLFVRYLLDYYVIRRDFADGQGVYTLACYNEDDSAAQNRLRQYQSMLYVSTDFYRWLKPFVQYLMKEGPNDPQAILNKLKAIDKELHKMPESAADWSCGKIDRYWFWRLDYCLWDRRNELFKNDKMDYADIVERYVFRENRSIEHLHPQDQSHNEQWPENDVNSFGNLAMISQSFNSTQSNDHIQVKFARIQEQIGNKALQSIKLLKMCMDANFECANWTRELVDKHKNEMIELLKKDY